MTALTSLKMAQLEKVSLLFRNAHAFTSTVLCVFMYYKCLWEREREEGIFLKSLKI